MTRGRLCGFLLALTQQSTASLGITPGVLPSAITCKLIIGLPWKIRPRFDRSLTESRPAAAKKVHIYSTGAIMRQNMRKCEKSALNKEFAQRSQVLCEHRA